MPARVRIRIQQRITGPLPRQHIIPLIIIRLRDPAENRSIRRIQTLRRQNILNPPRRMQMLHLPTLERRTGDVNTARSLEGAGLTALWIQSVIPYERIGTPMSFDPYTTPEEEWPPLWRTLSERNFIEARQLLKAGAHLDEIIEGDGDTILHRAAQEDDVEMVEFYLEHGCPRTMETFDYIAKTPLIRAAGSGKTNIVVRLLSAGANPNAHDEARIGNTAIHEAVHGGQVAIVSLLLRAGADPLIPGWMALTAVDQAHHKIDGGLDSTNALEIQKMLAPSQAR